MLLRIVAPHFVAGVITGPGRRGASVLDDEYVIRTAPILQYMMGWREGHVYDYCRRKGWSYSHH